VQPDDPDELDPGLARDRTSLSWVRTAIAFAAVGAVLLRQQPVIGLIVLAEAPLIWALGHFISNETAPSGLPSRRLLLVTVAVTVVALLAIITVLIGHAPAGLDQLLPHHG
jgi:uncharacterized membrane protein YidH (DUF202 family)